MFIVPSKTKYKTETNRSLGKPVISGSASKAELEAAAKRYGWTRRELSAKEIREMSSGECRYHEVCNPDQFNAAFQRQANIEHNEREMTTVAGKTFWDKYWNTQNQADPQEAKRIAGELELFMSAYPQFIASRPENQVVLEYLKDRHLELNYRNLATAFEKLVLEGKVWIDPSSIACGSESEVSGSALATHRNFYKLIQPQQRVSPVDRMSADDFKAAAEATHPELRDGRVPAMVADRNTKAQATAQHFQHAADHTSKANVVTVTDFPQQPHGVPPQPDKVSFRKKVQSMTAEEIRKECEIDPSFRDALDHLR